MPSIKRSVKSSTLNFQNNNNTNTSIGGMTEMIFNFTPYYVPINKVFKIADYEEAVHSRTIDIDGLVDIEGLLTEL